jgi:hypothetical protein
MPIMNAVYPVTALYRSVAAFWFYLRYGRLHARQVLQARREQGDELGAEPSMQD